MGVENKMAGHALSAHTGALFTRPVALSMGLLALLVVGGVALVRLPFELAPDVNLPSLSITAAWPNAPAESVERYVTSPLEEAARSVKGVRHVESLSSEGEARLDVRYDGNVDMDFARLELAEKLSWNAGRLPAGTRGPVIGRYVPPDLGQLQGFLTFSLSGDASTPDLRSYAEEHIAPHLLSIPGVAGVNVFGGEEEAVAVEVQGRASDARGITLLSVGRALEGTSTEGVIRDGTGSRKIAAVRDRTAMLQNLGRTLIPRGPGENPLRLMEAATIGLKTSEAYTMSRINGNPAVTLEISREPHTHLLRLVDDVAGRVNIINDQLPAGMRLKKEVDQSMRMRQEMQKLHNDLAWSLLAIAGILLLSLGSLRGAIVTLGSIAFSLAGTFILFWLAGISLHLLTLAGLTLGLGRLVDDAVVVTDALQRGGAGNEALTCSLRRIRLPVAASTLSTLGALAPLAFIPDDLRPYLMEFAVAVGASLIMSLLVSFTMIPAAAAHGVLPLAVPPVLAACGRKAEALYRRILQAVSRYRKTALIAALWAFGLPLWLLPLRIEGANPAAALYNATVGSKHAVAWRPFLERILGGSSRLFFTGVVTGDMWETGTETAVLVWIIFPQGTDRWCYDSTAFAFEREALACCKGQAVVTARVSTGSALIQVAFPDSVAASALPHTLKQRLSLLAASTGGGAVTVAGFGPGFSTGTEEAPSYTVRARGYNYQGVRNLANHVLRVLRNDPRVIDAEIDRSFGRYPRSTDIALRIDRDAARAVGVTMAGVVAAVREHAGGSASRLEMSLAGKRMPLSIIPAGAGHFSTSELLSLRVRNGAGTGIAIGDIATMTRQRVPSEIVREDRQYVQWISFQYCGPSAYGDPFLDRTLASITPPPGYRLDRGTPYRELSGESRQAMIWLCLCGILIVFMVTSALYESLTVPLVVLLTMPFSAIGLFMTFALTGLPFGRGGFAAALLLIGIAASNAIVLVDALQRRTRVPGGVVADAACERLRPILVTTLATAGGLVPMLSSDHGGIWYTLAIGTIGGLVSSTIMTLLLLPALFARRDGSA